MTSKPFSILFGILALIGMFIVGPAFGQTANEIDMAKNVNSPDASCVAAKNCFSPNPLTVAAGTTVTWKNTGDASHSILSGKLADNNDNPLFESGATLIAPGKTFTFTFANAGTYDYFCTIHPWMTGQVIVGGAAATTPNNATASNNATVPEFGPVASIVLAIAVMSMIVFVAKTRAIPKL